MPPKKQQPTKKTRAVKKPARKPRVQPIIHEAEKQLVKVVVEQPKPQRRRRAPAAPKIERKAAPVEVKDISEPVKQWSPAGLYQAPAGQGYTLDPLKNSSELEKQLSKFFGSFSGSLAANEKVVEPTPKREVVPEGSSSYYSIPRGLTIASIERASPGFRSDLMYLMRKYDYSELRATLDTVKTLLKADKVDDMDKATLMAHIWIADKIENARL